MSARVGSAFLPVRDPARSAEWYGRTLGLRPREVTPWSAVLDGADGSSAVTLMGPASGISATPGLPWAPCSFILDDLARARERMAAAGLAPTPVEGDTHVCLFFTVEDPDGNTLLLVDR